jgi:hypothetical protein
MIFPKYAISYTPSAYLNTFSAFQIGCDVRMKQRLNLSIETGMIFRSIYSNRSQGTKIRIGLDYGYKATKNEIKTVGLNLVLRNTISPVTDVFYLEENEFINLNYHKASTIYGAQARVGRVLKLAERLNFKTNIGLGVGYLLVRDINLIPPEGAKLFNTEEEWLIADRTEGNYIVPLGSVSLTFLYAMY